MLMDRFACLEEYLGSAYLAGMGERLRLDRMMYARGGEFLLAHCWSCDAEHAMPMQPQHPADGHLVWRETLRCPGCLQVGRKRFGVHLLGELMAPGGLPPYVTEQVSCSFLAARRRWPDVVGSEFVPSMAQQAMQTLKLNFLAQSTSLAVRHEDLTRLTLADGSVGGMLSMDVLEHVPDTRAVLREARRVLVRGAPFVVTVPFLNGSQATSIRAAVEADGSIRHLLEPEYHGDPLNDDGVLCFYHFGWDLLDAMRAAGFARAEIVFAWDPHYGYLTEQSAFVGYA